MKRNETKWKICTLRNGKSVLCEMKNLYFAKWKIDCTHQAQRISFHKRTQAYYTEKVRKVFEYHREIKLDTIFSPTGHMQKHRRSCQKLVIVMV